MVASSLATFHPLYSSVYTCLSCAQPLPASRVVRNPVCRIVGDHNKDLSHCHIGALTKRNPFRLQNRHGTPICQVGRDDDSSLGMQELGAENANSSRQMLKPYTSVGTRQEEGGILAIGNAAWRKVTVHALLVGTLLVGVSSAEATDALKTCACLLKECRVELARCIADPGCAANVACLQTCNNRPDETECQIGCGDLFENQVVDQFNDCAVSRKGCVPQKQDEGLFPVPPPSALVQKFNPQDFTGKWYISSGFNKTFDTFDCQLHEFSASPNEITAKLAWRIPTPDGGFFTRSALQHFVQDEKQPGVLYNHGNEFLHYQDDWYILASKTDNSPDDYIFVYYRGKNDAWDGYGGAVVYTRSSTLPDSIIPELTAAAKQVGLDFNKFTKTDNSCGPEPPLFARLEKKAVEEEQFIAEEVVEEEQFLLKEVKGVVNRVGQIFGDIVKSESDLLKREEDLLLKELGDEEKALLNDLQMEAKDIERLFGKALPIRKLR